MLECETQLQKNMGFRRDCPSYAPGGVLRSSTGYILGPSRVYGFPKPQLQGLKPHGCQLCKPWRERMTNKSFYLVRAAQLDNLFVSRQKLRSKAVAYVDAEEGSGHLFY